VSTTSIWTDVYKEKEKYINPFYNDSFSQDLLPDYSYYKLRFWEEYFFKWNNNNQSNTFTLTNNKNPL
jgi:hypothetical protein